MKCEHPNVKLFHPCPQCGALAEPAGAVEYFNIFGIKPRFFIDTNKVQNEFYALSRVLHPDRFHGKSSFEGATQWFAILNKAWLTLKFPTERAEYLFQLAHFEPQKSKTALPPALAEEYFDLQEALEDSALKNQEKENKLEEFSKKMSGQKKAADEARDLAFKEWEDAGAPLNGSASIFFEKAAREMNQKAYLESMAHDLKKYNDLKKHNDLKKNLET